MPTNRERKMASIHGPEYDAYYKGRNSVWNGDTKASRDEFETSAEWSSYIRGRRSAQAEERLDMDTEWD
jgi:hypothetical protein